MEFADFMMFHKVRAIVSIEKFPKPPLALFSSFSAWFLPKGGFLSRATDFFQKISSILSQLSLKQKNSANFT